MKKTLDLSRSVYDLVQEYPELREVLYQIGFSEIARDAMLSSVGKIMTIPRGAKIRGVSMETILSALEKAGFDTGPAPGTDTASGADTASKAEVGQTASTPEEERRQLLKSYLRRLKNDEDLETVRADFARTFEDVDAAEIMDAEQEMISEGTPVEDIQSLCDLHSALFHGHTRQERIANAEREVAHSIARRAAAQADMSPAAAMERIPGHPLQTLAEENRRMQSLAGQYRKTGNPELLDSLREIAIHYAKKGDLLYPLLNVKYGVSGPSQVMWTVDDEIRDELAGLARTQARDAAWKARLDSVLQRALEMIYKEENILFPICADQFQPEDWYRIYEDAKDYDRCLGVSPQTWPEAETALAQEKKSAPALADGLITMNGGSMSLKELQALLNVIPMEITFVDAGNINRFFNEGHKVFKRPAAAIGREVFSCHPPKIEPMVRQIISEFRQGTRDEVSIWMNKGGKPFLVRYMAVRSPEGTYLGTAELVQDMEFAREHFEAEKKDRED